MPRLPFMRFYPADYLLATRALTDTEKAIWMDLLCFMWLKDSNRGRIESDRDDLARMVGRDRITLDITLDALKRKGVCDLEDRENQVVFVECRRMVRDAKGLEMNNFRQKRFNASNNARITPNITLQKTEDRRHIKTKEASGFMPLEMSIPPDLLESAAEIKDWIEYKKQRGQSYKPKGLEALWRKLRSIPADRRREAIDRSMANNWSGIFEVPVSSQIAKKEVPHWSEVALTK